MPFRAVAPERREMPSTSAGDDFRGRNKIRWGTQRTLRCPAAGLSLRTFEEYRVRSYLRQDPHNVGLTATLPQQDDLAPDRRLDRHAK